MNNQEAYHFGQGVKFKNPCGIARNFEHPDFHSWLEADIERVAVRGPLSARKQT